MISPFTHTLLIGTKLEVYTSSLAFGQMRQEIVDGVGQGFPALVFMIGTLAGMAGGFLALLALRLAVGAD